MTQFWHGWLVIWCLAVGLFGLVLTTGAFDATDGAVRAMFTLMGDDGAPMPPAQHFAIALMGAVTLGWAVTIYAVVATAGTNGRAWRLLTTGMVIWFLVDSTLSIATGFGLNAVSNSIFLAAFLLPILRSGLLRAA